MPAYRQTFFNIPVCHCQELQRIFRLNPFPRPPDGAYQPPALCQARRKVPSKNMTGLSARLDTGNPLTTGKTAQSDGERWWGGKGNLPILLTWLDLRCNKKETKVNKIKQKSKKGFFHFASKFLSAFCQNLPLSIPPFFDLQISPSCIFLCHFVDILDKPSDFAF